MLQKDELLGVDYTIDKEQTMSSPDLEETKEEQMSEDDVSEVPNGTLWSEYGDAGDSLLYPDISTRFPFKTSDRLLDDIVHDLSFIRSQEHDILYSDLHNGILRSPLLPYSRKISQLNAYSLGTLVDQVVLQTKYEYESVSCPNHNKLQVFMGVLIDPNHQYPTTCDALPKVPIYHLKVTVKTRLLMERAKKQVGITHYHLLDETELHPFDKQDLQTFDPIDPQLVDYAIYVSSDTNKMVLIEIFKPEFGSEEETQEWTEEAIKTRYENACKKFGSLEPQNVPTQAECINTLFKIFKGPLKRKSSDEPLKTINSDNVVLNSHMDPDWLTSRYKFELHIEKDEETGENIPEYEPPDLTNYVQDWKVRKLRESFTRKCVELIFLGKMSVKLLNKETCSKIPKVVRSFNVIQTVSTQTFWFQMLGEYRSMLSSEPTSPMDSNHHFVNLSACYHYLDRDIIRNYETQCVLDPQNIGVYFDALTFIANRKGAYQLVAYCGKQEVVGQESLDHALRLFGIDSKEVDIITVTDSVLISIYKTESAAPSYSNHHSDLKNALRILAKYKKSPKLRFYADYEPYKSISQAYDTLEVDESVDDDIIQTAYSIKVNDSPGLKIECDRALYSVAVHKKSLALFNYLVQQCPEFQQYYGANEFTYQDALNLLQLNENAGDDTVLEVFQRKWFKEAAFDPDHFLNLRGALTKIGFERNSKLILHFIDTGTTDASCLPVDNWPTGLNNIGNTCYLNSLLQYYFSIAPLRQYVLNYQKTVEHFQHNHVNSSRRIGGREVSEAEVERSVQFLYQLRDLFHAMIYSKERYVTPRKELAYLAFAPSNVGVEFELSAPAILDTSVNNDTSSTDNMSSQIALPKSDKNSLIDLAKDDTCEDLDISMAENLESRDSGSKDSEVEDILMSDAEKDIIMNTSTRVAKISSDQLENALEMGRQQDVTECIGNVLFQLESASDPINVDEDNEQNDLVKQLFYGNIKQTIIPLKNETAVRIKIERFLSLLVNIGDHPKDIYDALDSYFSDEYLKMEEYGEVKRTVAATDFPTILQIQIQRVYYDRERFMPFKSIEPLPFNEVLYMDRYTDTKNDLLISKKEEARKMKEQLLTLKKRQKELLSINDLGLSRKAALMETTKFLKSDVLETQEIEVDDKYVLVQQLTDIVGDIDKELTKLYHDIINLENKISKQFDEFKKIAYSLFAVFIHRGEASYGHYWVYIKDRSKNSIWRKYNDETITEVPESEVFNFTEGNTATPYFLVYVKQGHENEIEPLKRIVEH